MRELSLAVVLVSASALAYWAPDHVKLNKQVFCKGKPWGDAGFKRGNRTVKSTLDYARSVLYLARPGRCGDEASDDALRLRGVKFQESSVFEGTPRPGLETPTDAPNASFTLLEWNANGGLWEDGFNSFSEATKWGGRRAVNHFHDPLTGSGGYTGLTAADWASGAPYVDLLRRGISATEWVKNGTSGGDAGKNLWGYPTIGESMHRAFTEKEKEKRQSGLACAFRAMGQVEHLVEDNTVPDHTRDLAHPGDGWEEYMNSFGSSLFSNYTGGAWATFPVKQIEANGLRALWDRDVYSETPEITWTSGFDPPGLSEYVNANFLAWNIFTKPGFPVEFSTVPDDVGQPFKRGWRLSVGPSEVPLGFGLGLRTNSVTYPWPRLAPLSAPWWYPSAPRTVPLPVIAREQPSGGKAIDGEAWNHYRKPLISHALGYAQSVVSLALQPARAEVVPSPDGDPLILRVRLWNLWDSANPHAVTWHVKKVELVGVRTNKDRPFPFANEDPITIFTPALDIAPGANATTPEITVEWQQRGPYRTMSHSAVLVTAEIGSGNTKTPLLFSVPIVNAAVFIKQTSGVDITGTYTNNTPNCSTGSCAYSGEHGVYWNPEHHIVQGKIELAPSELDIFGRPADSELKTVQKEDAHVAGVALFGLSRVTNSLQPVRVQTSTLNLGGASQLEATSVPGVFVRKPDAPETADGTIEFTADIHSKDFDVPDIDPIVDAHRASGAIYLAVWTTAGAVQLQRLVVWPWLHPNDAQSVIAPQACDVFSSWRLIDEARGDCSHSASQNMGVCQNYTFRRQRTSIVLGDMGIARAVLTMGAQIPSFINAFGFSNDIRVTSFFGFPVALAGEGTLPAEVKQPPMFYPDGNGEDVIPYFAPGGIAYFYAENARGNGQCGGNPAPPIKPRVAEYKRVFTPATVMALKDAFGITAPAEWTFTLSAQ